MIARRALAGLLLLTLCATWVPPPASAQFISGGPAPTWGTFPPTLPIIPIRLPHESVPWSTPYSNADYVLTFKGSGMPPTSVQFDHLDARQICVFWERDPAKPLNVIAKAYAVASHGALLAYGWWSVPRYSSQTLDTITVARAGWPSTPLLTGYKSTPVIAREDNLSCMTTVGTVMSDGTYDNRWFAQAIGAARYTNTRRAMRMGVQYFNLRLWYETRAGTELQVTFQRRPSIAWVHYNLSAPATERWTTDVVQEPVVFRGSPYDFWTDPNGHLNYSGAEQQTRWWAWLKLRAANGGIAEGYIIGMVNSEELVVNGVPATVPAMSGVGALIQAEGKGEKILRLTAAAQIDQLSPLTDAATKQKIREALAAPGPLVIVTQAPTTASTGWRGTPWIAWSYDGGTAFHMGTYLGILRGAAGHASPAGAAPPGGATGVSGADIATSQAKGLAGVAGVLGALGYAGNQTGTPTGKAIGAAFGALAAFALGLAGALGIKVTLNDMNNATPKQGHVDAAPTTDPTEQGQEPSLPEGTVTVGPISEVDGSGQGFGDGPGEGDGGQGGDGGPGPGSCC